MKLGDMVLALHERLDSAGIPHAVGGALALGYCTEEPRGTRDIDLNIFIAPDRFDEVLAALPEAIRVTPQQRRLALRDGQVRLWWGDTPVDLFFAYHPFHAYAAQRVRMVPFAGKTIPVLSCTDLAVFKVFFSRTKDWADLETMAEAGTLDPMELVGWIDELLGPEDSARVKELFSARGRQRRRRAL